MAQIVDWGNAMEDKKMVNKTVAVWLLDPLKYCVEFLAEEIALSALNERGLTALSALPLVLKQAKIGIRDPKLIQAFDRLLVQAPSDAMLANEEIQRDFSKSKAHGSIGFWSAIETTVEDVFNGFITNTDWAEQRLLSTIPNIKVPKRSGISPFEFNRRLFRASENAVKGEANVARRYQFILRSFDIDPTITDADLDILNELSEMRNVILHRRGIVDDVFVYKCPNSGYKPGDVYKIDRIKYMSFYDACSAFISSMFDKASRHIIVPGTQSG